MMTKLIATVTLTLALLASGCTGTGTGGAMWPYGANSENGGPPSSGRCQADG